MEIFDKAKAIINKLLAGELPPGREPPPVKDSEPPEASKPAEVISETAHYKINKMLVGELLVGDGNEVAHIDLIIGPSRKPGGNSLTSNALTNNKDGFTHTACGGSAKSAL